MLGKSYVYITGLCLVKDCAFPSTSSITLSIISIILVVW